MQPSKISFVVQSMSVSTGSKEFYKPVKDKEGFYLMPGFIFNQASRNSKEYDTVATVDCITNPQSRFNRMLVEGTLGGEHGHPFTEDIKRLCKIEDKNQAIFIQKVFTGTLKDGSDVIWVRFKPAGPYGKYFAEALEDPYRNACLSLRAVCVEGPTVNGVKKLYPKYFVTFDAVSGAGYKNCSQRTAHENADLIGHMEDYEVSVDYNDLTSDVGQDLVFMEDYKHDCLLEHLRADSIIIKNQIIRVNPAAYVESKMNSFHKMFK